MKTEKEIQTAWEIWILINRLNDLLWDRYDDEFIGIDLQEKVDKTRPREDPCLGPLGPLGLIDTQDKTEGSFRINPTTSTRDLKEKDLQAQNE
jgi:hypothetical protein